MIVKLDDEMYKLLTEEVEGAASLIEKKDDTSLNTLEIEVTDVQEMLLLINDEIVYRGLENQEEVNEFGKKLYALYDKILYQKRHN